MAILGIKELTFVTELVKMKKKKKKMKKKKKVKISDTIISTNIIKHFMELKEKTMIFVRTLAGN